VAPCLLFGNNGSASQKFRIVPVLAAVATIIGAIIGAAATIAAARITTGRRGNLDRPILYPVFFTSTPGSEEDDADAGDGDEDDTGEKSSLIRKIGIGIYAVVILLLSLFVTGPILMWLDGDNFPCKRLLIAFQLVSAALLLCVARWLAKRIDA
jgi:hypothetical protein